MAAVTSNLHSSKHHTKVQHTTIHCKLPSICRVWKDILACCLQYNAFINKCCGATCERAEMSHAQFNSNHSYTHSTTTSTECHVTHYGWLTVILRVQPHMMIWYMHSSLNHSLPLVVCMDLTFFLCRKSASKVSHSSCTISLWP